MGAVLLGGLLAASPGLIMGATRRSTPPATIGVGIVGFLLFIGALIAMLFVRCPKCSASISHTIARPVALSFGFRQRVNYCPYCGVNLDEACPESGSPITD